MRLCAFYAENSAKWTLVFFDMIRYNRVKKSAAAKKKSRSGLYDREKGTDKEASPMGSTGT